jgi:hypothetical protein
MSLAPPSRSPGPRAPLLLRALTGLLLTAGACGDPSSSFPTMGMAGIPSSTRIGSNLVLADVAVNGVSGGRLGVDTGSPIMLLDVTKFPGLVLPDKPQVTANVSAGDLTVDYVPLVQIRFTNDMDPLSFAGLFGGNVMRQFSVRLDYAHPDRAFRLGMPAMEMSVDGVETPGASAAFTLEGGGLIQLTATQRIAFPPTRIPVTVDIEGASHPFVLDTGASETAIRSTLYAAIKADGRAELTGLPISTVAGSTQASVTRVRTLTVAGATVVNPVVMTIGDELIDNLQNEVRHPVDGLLGGNFLREFMVTIDYPRGTLHLQRYTAATIVDEFKRVGFELGRGTGTHRYAIGVIYRGTDAELKQLSAGDEVASIDGQPLDALDSVAADALLNGTVGATHAVGLGKALLLPPDTTVDVLIEDLIPPP